MREAQYLRLRYRALFSHVGAVGAFVGVLMLLPLVAGIGAPLARATVAAFLVPGASLVALGLAVWRACRVPGVSLSRQEGGVIVVLGWLLACGVSAIPLACVEGLGPTKALFESTSGWTTTGLSVIDVTQAEPATLLWRSIMQLAGGAGLAIIMLAALTSVGSPSLAAAEGRAELLAPHVRASTLLVVRIYAGEVVLGILALWLAGMDGFDAINHAFCALSTGGFSTRAASIGHWDSPAIEAVVMALMVLGSANFVTLWCLLRGRWRAVTHNGEVRLMAAIVPLAAVALFLATTGPLFAGASKGARVAAFEVVSALTTTGYSTTTYSGWNSFGILLLVVLMLVGGATCSTAGGLKLARVHLLLRSLARELKRPLMPRTAVVDASTWEGEERQPITDARIRAAGTFLFLYLLTWLAAAAVFAAHGVALDAALFESASAIGTVGLSVGVTAPDAPGLVLWTATVGMLAGRLEFFVLIAALAKIVGDTRRMMRRGSP